MKQLIDHSLQYEILRKLDSIGPIERYTARHISCGTPVTLNRVPIASVDLDEILRDVQRFAVIRDPRVPLVMDAWRALDNFEVALIEYDHWALESREARAALEHLQGGYVHQVAYQTLLAVRSLHEASLSHQAINSACFTVLDGGIIFMKRPGLIARLESSVKGEGRFSVSGIQLASNLYAQDVAQWACLIGSVASGAEIIRDEEREVTGITMATIERARAAIRGSIQDRGLATLLNQAIDAWEPDGRGFENATEAFDAFRKAFPLEEIRG